MMKGLKVLFLITDIGFIIYWIVTFFEWIPKNMVFKDYDNAMIMAWNWSFFPLDIFISITGLYSLFLYRQKHALWRPFALISLVLTFCSGLQAIAFWVFIGDFDLMWWAFNLYLLLYPLYFIRKLLASHKNSCHSF
ncbi:DUF5360 family protein [Bacillus sp. CIS52]|uniref:DUF5360 family protein n=1 Tax=Bacillus TaxID=1386 RepID=UPI0005F89C09|nr:MULTISPECIES: DUF5360 family protein [Bacillus]OAZ65817.1 uncharacterized protein SRCM100169_01534 [Bacillus siamensis]UZD74573.1 YvaD family protein [Bacillus siamensis]